MRTKHFFKNVRMLTMALALCATVTTMMLAGCKKDEPWGSDYTLTASYTIDSTAALFTMLSPTCTFNVSVSEIRPSSMFFVISDTPDGEGTHYAGEMKKWSTTEFTTQIPVKVMRSLDGPVKYYIRAGVRTNNGNLSSEPIVYEAPVCTDIVAETSVSDITSRSVKVTVTFSKSVTNKDIEYESDGEMCPAHLFIQDMGPIGLIYLPDFEGKSVDVYVDNLPAKTQGSVRIGYGSNQKKILSERTFFTTL